MFPALDCTRLRPSDAFDAVLDAVSLAFPATSEAVSFAFEAVSAVVEADLNLLRRKRSRDCRSSVGGAAEGGIVMLIRTQVGRELQVLQADRCDTWSTMTVTKVRGM